MRELRDRIGDLKLASPSTTQINRPMRPAQPDSGSPAGPLHEAISALVNLGMKPVEAKRTCGAGWRTHLVAVYFNAAQMATIVLTTDRHTAKMLSCTARLAVR